MLPGGLIAILATIHPATCTAIAEHAASRGIAVIDAPVSGGRDAAARSELTVMMGGPEADCGRARPVFASFAAMIVRLGEIGAGQRAKLVNNTLLARHSRCYAGGTRNRGCALAGPCRAGRGDRTKQRQQLWP